MLGYCRNHADYQSFVVSNLSSVSDKNALLEYEDIISKLYILNMDYLKPIITDLYSPIGRPAQSQSEIFRAFILANHIGIPLDQLPSKLKHNFILRTITGFTESSLVGIASYYDFINRIIKLDERPRIKIKKRKPTKKIGKGKKLPPKNPGVVAKLVRRIIDKDESFAHRPEKKLQEIFAGVSVRQSVELGIVPKTVSVSGDGTCMKTGASHFGVKTCKCHEQGIYQCDCSRRFSDPNATWGWDSHNEFYYYGYTGYFISTYNKDLKADLPLYLRLVEASRHDSVSAVVALAEFRKLYPDLTIDTFISDSASDNYATYELMHEWKINAVIALNSTNRGNFKYPSHINIDADGTPICPANHKMILWGFCGKDRCRIKWRCPKACGRLDCSHDCSPSAYGRSIHTKPDWDLRLFTTIPRGSALWKELMKSRTAAERVNNRILNDYNIEHARTRGKKRISFFTTIAATNIHLDVQLRVARQARLFNFYALFGIPSIA